MISLRFSSDAATYRTVCLPTLTYVHISSVAFMWSTYPHVRWLTDTVIEWFNHLRQTKKNGPLARISQQPGHVSVPLGYVHAILSDGSRSSGFSTTFNIIHLPFRTCSPAMLTAVAPRRRPLALAISSNLLILLGKLLCSAVRGRAGCVPLKLASGIHAAIA